MPGENPFNKIELSVLISINLANHHNSFKQWKGSVLILAFLFFGISASWGGQLWIKFVVVFPALPDFSCWNLSTSLRAATSLGATVSNTSTPWNTLRYNLMWWALWPNNATMFCRPTLNTRSFSFRFHCDLCDNKIIALFAAENTRRINSEKGQNYDVHYAPHISLIFTDVCFSHV